MKYHLIKWPLRALAALPTQVLYKFSDIASFLLGNVLCYRRKVVRENLQNCFPGSHTVDLRRIEKRFYRNFTDNFVETLKLMHISDAEIERRVRFQDFDIIDDLLDQGKSVAVYFSHSFCWEWAPAMTRRMRHRPSEKCVYAQIYRPLRDKAFDRLMLELRSRFGSHSIPKETSLREFLQYRRDGVLSVTGFMSDQHPSHGDPGHFTYLLHRPTMMISGTETLARKLGMAVVYWDIKRTSRGHYCLKTVLMSEDASKNKPGELTEQYARLLEETILNDPANWLWSHKRWKHQVTPPANE